MKSRFSRFFSSPISWGYRMDSPFVTSCGLNAAKTRRRSAEVAAALFEIR